MSAHAPWSAEAASVLVAALPAEERLILPALQRLQSAFGYVPEGAVPVVAEELNVSRAEVVGVLTYYSDLRQEPPPPVVVQVCVAEACQAEGARTLVSGIETDFGVPLGARTTDGTVGFERVHCLGNCALGPAVMVNGRLIGRCDVARVRTAVAAAHGSGS